MPHIYSSSLTFTLGHCMTIFGWIYRLGRRSNKRCYYRFLRLYRLYHFLLLYGFIVVQLCLYSQTLNVLNWPLIRPLVLPFSVLAHPWRTVWNKANHQAKLLLKHRLLDFSNRFYHYLNRWQNSSDSVAKIFQY